MTSNRSAVMTSGQSRRSAVWALRVNCLAAAVILIIEFGMGTAVNLYVSVPAHKAFFSAVFGDGTLAAHAIIALGLLAAGASALIRSIQAKRALIWTVLGLIAILVAAGAGAGFVNNGDASGSLTMALASAVAMIAYIVPLFTLAPA